jgi:hypothetical protein
MALCVRISRLYGTWFSFPFFPSAEAPGCYRSPLQGGIFGEFFSTGA